MNCSPARPPFDKAQFRDLGLQEMLRIIREQEPPRPSTRLSSSDRLPSIAAARVTEPARLTQAIRGELDWIVMKALEKDRNRRYENASGFAADLSRYLNGEPVLAFPPSAAYRLRKLAARYRAPLFAGALVLLVLVSGTALSTWQAIRATRAEATALANERRALAHEQAARAAAAAENLARQAEAHERRRAESQARKVEAQRLTLESNHRLNNLVIDEILTVLRDVPLPAARQHALVTTAMRRLSELDPDERADALHTMGNHLTTLKQFPAALKAYNEGLALQPQHAGIYVSRGDLLFRQQNFTGAADDYTAAIEHRRPDDPANSHAPYARRGFALCNQGQYDAALADFQASFAEAPRTTLNLLAQSFRGGGITNAVFDEAVRGGVSALFERYVEDERRSHAARLYVAEKLGDLNLFDLARRHLTVLVDENSSSYYPHYSLAILALLHRDQDDYRRVCAAMFARSAAQSRDEFVTYTGYAAALAPGAVDDYTPLIGAIRGALARRPQSAQRLLTLGGLLLRSGEYDEAVQPLQAALTAKDEVQAAPLTGRYFLAIAYQRLGRHDDAVRQLHTGLQTSTSYNTWRYQAIHKLLREEARQLIEPDK